MTLHWHYKKTQPFYTQGKDTTRPNFSREERSEVGILIREGLQNPLDARRDDLQGPVQVVMRHLEPGTFDVAYLDEIIDHTYRERLMAASEVNLPAASAASVFVIEDFGTKGLLGDYQNFDADGADQNWNAFWHREGEGAKGKASNGGAGQGKITYFTHSIASVVLGLTVRSTDMKRLLMGRAAMMRDYLFSDGAKYIRSSYWTSSDTEPLPEAEGVELDRFCKAFSLLRRPDASGLSLVIPFAKPFAKQEAITSVILDFYMPIAANRLKVSVGETHITAKTIDGIADHFISDAQAIATSSTFTKAYRSFARGIIADSNTTATLDDGWNRDSSIPEAAFPEGTLTSLRSKLESGERVAIRLPLAVKRRGGEPVQTFFNVYIETPPDLERNEEAFVRRDLLIGAESHITAGAFVQKTRSMTWIQDQALSDFLLAAEEPTHLKWNASLARDKATYVNPDHTLRSIRQAVPRLLSVLLSGEAQKDFRALARYFSKPAENSNRSGDEGNSKRKPVVSVPPVPPPPPVSKPFKIVTEGTTIRVMPNGAKGPQNSQLPLNAELELAYEGLDQDPFEAYDPYDFDMAQAEAYPVIARGLTIRSSSDNRLNIEFTDPDFLLEISGFDPNVRLRARLNYDWPGTAEVASQEALNG
jgi:hypothetical protein